MTLNVFSFFYVNAECDSQCSDNEAAPIEVVQPHVLAIASLVPVQKSSPERRNQKEIVAGEERPKFLNTPKTEDAQGIYTVFIHLFIYSLFSFPCILACKFNTRHTLCVLFTKPRDKLVC
jgi:hypothetical protein